MILYIQTNMLVHISGGNDGTHQPKEPVHTGDKFIIFFLLNEILHSRITHTLFNVGIVVLYYLPVMK